MKIKDPGFRQGRDLTAHENLLQQILGVRGKSIYRPPITLCPWGVFAIWASEAQYLGNIVHVCTCMYVL